MSLENAESPAKSRTMVRYLTGDDLVFEAFTFY